MPRAFQYRPRFVDIRVRPPSVEEEEKAKADAVGLKPGERACDHPGCRKPATAKAPKSREMLNEHYWFCQPHAAEYNRHWDFFAGMSEGEIRKRQQEELFTGGRPTWEMKAGRNSREAASFSAKFGKGEGYRDPYGMFGGQGVKREAPQAEARQLGKIERAALADLDLEVDAEGPQIRQRYTELVRRLHPDANGGDRSGEHKLQRVIKAYQSLRKAGMV
ncbi:J domain-containing protein [Phenylobacterium immobile]|jgi:hypothetical protein|uniref:J domain-containing protein n=1 Tax=Phenylobacterium immobile TaxID=21 RepID=UPI000A4CEA9D|nr:J domain-containing protein [Phenylobacterium immobile]